MKKAITILCGLCMILLSCGQQGDNKNNGTTATTSQPVETVSPGKKIFINNCLQCHSLKQDKNGPKLEGVLTRWNNDTTMVVAYIKNSQQVIGAGNARAVKVYHDWNEAAMPPFPNLSDADIKELLAYINAGAE